jgi:hypothetical protein
MAGHRWQPPRRDSRSPPRYGAPPGR